MCLVLQADADYFLPEMALSSMSNKPLLLGLKTFRENKKGGLAPLVSWHKPYKRDREWYVPRQCMQPVELIINYKGFQPKMKLGAHAWLVPKHVSFAHREGDTILTGSSYGCVHVIGFEQGDVQMIDNISVVVRRFICLSPEEIQAMIAQCGEIERTEGMRTVFRFRIDGETL